MIGSRSDITLFAIMSWCVLLGVTTSSCGQDATVNPHADPWEVYQGREGDSPPTDPIVIEGCHDSFGMGPVWQMVEDKQAALAESEWIVVLGTTKKLKYLASGETDGDIDYAEEMASITTEARSLGVEMLDSTDELQLVAAGPPEALLELAERSCFITVLDLTGFHCDCAPAQCQEARSCELVRQSPELPDEEARLTAERAYEISGYTSSVIACDADFDQGSQYASVFATDFRAVRWAHSTDGRIHSWQNSSCR